jgi:hypothetical protein
VSRLLGERFALERELGAGGMARVYLGKDQVLDRPVAIKVLRPSYGDTGISSRFEREGRTAARLSHPNIVQVYDAGEGEMEGRDVAYIVMEYVRGGDLKRYMDEKGPIPGKELARLGAEVSSGLVHAHEAGVIHRDIKPHNILLDDRGRPKLTDFGIARALDATQATQTGSYLGTALYSSPEQLRGEKVTPKSDIYSLGMTLYQAAAGAAPFSGTPLEIASQHVSRTPTAPSVLGADLSGEFEQLILDCIEKDPDRRPTAEEVHERLRKEAAPVRNAPAFAAPPIPEPPTSELTAPEPSPTRSTRATPPEEPAAAPPSDGTTDGTPGGASGGMPGGGRRGGGRSRRGPILLAAVVLLLVLMGVVAYAMIGGSEGTETAEVAQEESPPEQDQSAGAVEETASEQAAVEDTAGGGQEDTTGGDSEADSSEQAAAQAVEDYYTAAADGDYDEAWNLLSAGYRQQQGSQAAYTSQFDTLQNIEFIEGPTAQLSGNDTATVTGVTRATHSDRTERNQGTWTLVDEDGGWKISDQAVSRLGLE